MDASPYDIRLARVDDLDLIKASIRRTLNNPEGRSQRKKFADAVERGELLRMTAPPSASVKVEAEKEVWNQVFAETAGFRPDGREYSRSKWWNLWTWTAANEQVDRSREQQNRFRGPPMRGRR